MYGVYHEFEPKRNVLSVLNQGITRWFVLIIIYTCEVKEWEGREEGGETAP